MNGAYPEEVGVGGGGQVLDDGPVGQDDVHGAHAVEGETPGPTRESEASMSSLSANTDVRTAKESQHPSWGAQGGRTKRCEGVRDPCQRA